MTKNIKNMDRNLRSCWYKDEGGDYYFALTRYIIDGTIRSCGGEECIDYTLADNQTPLVKLPWRAFEELKIYILETYKEYNSLEINDALGLRSLEDWK